MVYAKARTNLQVCAWEEFWIEQRMKTRCRRFVSVSFWSILLCVCKTLYSECSASFYLFWPKIENWECSLPLRKLRTGQNIWTLKCFQSGHWELRSERRNTQKQHPRRRKQLTTRTEVIYWEDSLHYLCDRMITKRLQTSQLTRASANKRVGLWTLVLPRSSELIRICTLSSSLTSRCLSVSAD